MLPVSRQCSGKEEESFDLYALVEMNWERIFTALINSRKHRVLLPGAYVENHHIVPRWCGGSDDPSNLIQLTAREHYVAHLLLAKAHGGRHWGAVAVLASARPERFNGSTRVQPSRTVAIWLEKIRQVGPEIAAAAVGTKREKGILAIAAQKAAQTKRSTGTHAMAGKKAAATLELRRSLRSEASCPQVPNCAPE